MDPANVYGVGREEEIPNFQWLYSGAGVVLELFLILSTPATIPQPCRKVKRRSFTVPPVHFPFWWILASHHPGPYSCTHAPTYFQFSAYLDRSGRPRAS